jgi:hypothetical protein
MTDGRESLAKNAAGALMMTTSWLFSRRGRKRFTIATILTGIVLAFGVVRPGMVFGQAPGRLVAPNGKSLLGTILGTSPTDVEIEDEDGDLKRVPLDKIVEVQFSDEPAKLASARSFLMRGRSGDALGELESVLESELEGVPALVLAEMEFAKAAAAGQMAVESGDGVPAADAMVTGFLTKHPRSHHFFEMQQLLGLRCAVQGACGFQDPGVQRQGAGPRQRRKVCRGRSGIRCCPCGQCRRRSQPHAQKGGCARQGPGALTAGQACRCDQACQSHD